HHPQPCVPERTVLNDLVRPFVPDVAGTARPPACISVPPAVPPAPAMALPPPAVGLESAGPSARTACPVRDLPGCKRDHPASRPAQGGCFGRQPPRDAAADLQRRCR